MINISKPVLLVLVTFSVAIIVALEFIQLLIVFQAFPSVFPDKIWSPIITSVPISITAIAAVVALLQLLLILKQAKARNEMDNSIENYNEASLLPLSPEQRRRADREAWTMRDDLAPEVHFSSREIKSYLQSQGSPGKRLAALCIVQ